jgi:hypothetical protein
VAGAGGRIAEQTAPDAERPNAPRRERLAGLAVVRQVLRDEAEPWLEPVGAMVCEFTFYGDPPVPQEWELWSFDCPSLEHFVDRVEQEPAFADLMTREPLRTRVYWKRS